MHKWYRLSEIRGVVKVARYATRLLLVVTVALSLLGFLPAKVQAQVNPVDLELGGEGATPWMISNIQPGDSGIKMVELHNVGSEDGFVTIWVSDIISNEGMNPESETGDTTGPGEFENYLLLDLTAEGLSSNVNLPAIINNLPQNATGPDYIEIRPLKEGETVFLRWDWEFLAQAGNDVQGDDISFSINYLLRELAPPPSLPGGGPAIIIGEKERETVKAVLETNMLGEELGVETEADGTLREPLTLTDPDGLFVIEVDSGSKIASIDGVPITRLELSVLEESIESPDDIVILSPTYKVTGYINELEISPITFNPSAKLTILYDPRDLPENVFLPFVASYTVDQGLIPIEPAPGTIVEIGKAKAQISHESLFVVAAKLVPPPPPLPPMFEVSNFIINPGQSEIGQPVIISFEIANVGETVGSYQLQLKIDGIVRIVREITLAAKSSETVSFEIDNLSVGRHEVKVAGLSGYFNVVSTAALPPTSAIDWLMLDLSIAAVVCAGLLTLYLLRRRL